jgi:hypothetical protein
VFVGADCGMQVCGVLYLTRVEHALYTLRPVIGYGPYEGTLEEEETDSTAHMQCTRHKPQAANSKAPQSQAMLRPPMLADQTEAVSSKKGLFPNSIPSKREC